jgi:two-component system sensor histidine kinase DesK
MVARLSPHQRSGRFIRHATVGAVACSVVVPVLEFARITAGSPPGSARALPALVATAGYLPLHVRHVWYATRGSRPPGGGWTLTVMAAVIIGALAVVGTSWLTALHALAVSTLIIVRPPWSVPLVAGMVAAPAPLAMAFGDPEWAPFHAVSVVWRGAVLFVLLWLIGATRRLEAARRELAEEAVTRERLRIDGELRRTLSSALEEIAERGRRAGDSSTREPAVLQAQLRALAERSRQALAEARRMVARYQQVPLRDELDTAAGLLRAVGIETRLLLPPSGLPETIEAAPRAALRAAVARLLRDDTARHCSIVLARRDGRVWLELRADGSGAEPTTEVAVG